MGKAKRHKPAHAARNDGLRKTLTLVAAAVGGAVVAVCIPVLLLRQGQAASTSSDGCNCGNDWAAPSPKAFEKFEYAGGCDFDVLDAFPSQEEFDRVYWNKRPVLIINGTADWPARSKWTKAFIGDQLSGGDWGSAWFKASDIHASYHIRDYFRNDSNLTDIQRETKNVRQFLCNDVCRSGLQHGDQDYLFDRDEWRKAAPHLEDDAIAPPVVAAHYEARWHERWSKYLLISAEGSGINFHRHTNAFNGLVVGRKRWFLYPPSFAMPRETEVIGTLKWLLEVYRPSWAAKRKGEAGRDGLEQCMQGEGDLLYVPQHWWHATVALGEGIGISGQFVRRLTEILGRVKSALHAGRVDEALEQLELILEHIDEVETDLAVAVASDAAAMHAQLGHKRQAEEYARMAIAQSEHHRRGDPTGARQLLHDLKSGKTVRVKQK